MNSLFPLFLKLEGRLCLVVGGGPIATEKVNGLLLSGARIRVIAPEASETVQELARSGLLSWAQKRFEPADMDHAMLVIAATGDARVNEEIYQEAERRGVLCNAVDEPGHCHFYYPAVVRRGDLQIAISTGGHSPALAQRLRRELEAQFSPAYGDWLQWLGKMRTWLFRRGIETEKRKYALHRLASRESFERFSARKRQNVEIGNG